MSERPGREVRVVAPCAFREDAPNINWCHDVFKKHCAGCRGNGFRDVVVTVDPQDDAT